MSPKGVYDRSTARPRGSAGRATANDRAPRRRQGVADPKPSTTGRAMSEDVAEVSAKVNKAIEAIRRPFTSFVADFSALQVSREELAPKFMKAFNLWATETAGSFIEFVRLLVPEVPMSSRTTEDGPGYRDHRAYQTADYLRRKAAEISRAQSSPTERAQAIANRPVSHVVGLSRLIRSVMPLLDAGAQGQLWEAMRSQLHWSENMVKNVQTLTQSEPPLVVVREPRGLHALGMLRLTIPATPSNAAHNAEEELETVTRTGTHG